MDQLSVFFGQLMMLYFLAVGLCMLFNRDAFREAYREILTNPGIGLISAIMSLILGAVIVVLHSRFFLNWSILVSIIGWYMYLKGFLRVMFPQLNEKALAILDNNTAYILLGSIQLGIAIYFGISLYALG